MRVKKYIGKALILSIILGFYAIGIAQAVSVEVTCNPQVIPTPGGTTTITVTSDTGASGSITVITPGGDERGIAASQASCKASSWEV